MQPDDYIEANRTMWNETAGVHARGYVVELQERIKAPDFSTFDPVEKKIFARIGLEGKAVVQLACNNGRELVSVKKAGAARCLGVDVSDKFIEQARQLADLGGVEVEFLRTSVYDLSSDLDGQFDLVYITIGALGWMPDLEAFFGIAARLLKQGGQIFVYEMHPILNMFDPDKGLEFEASYFRTEPFEDGEGPDYMDPSQIIKSTSYWFPFKLADIIGGCLRHGLFITDFEEYPHDFSEAFKPFEDFPIKPPLSFSLVARKAVLRDQNIGSV